MYGSHLSVAGGMINALNRAEELGLECLQVFTKNQRQWAVKPLDPGEQREWLDKLKAMGWHRRSGPDYVVSHNSYLINMASPSADAWGRSADAQRVEIERCEALKIPLCVAHPGAHLGTPRKPGEPNRLEGKPNQDENGGLKRIVKALDRIHRELPGYRTITCLETTVGSGTNLGYDFAHLAYIREHVREPERVGFCFDTCHVTAAGYDMTNDARAEAVLRSFNRICGLKHLKVFHFNDSIGDVGSRKDRHAHIGEGTCGKSCFGAILARSTLKRRPMILETAKGEDKSGLEWDLVNIRRLKRLEKRTVR
jgi:deoxyribonuclease-4